MRWQTTNKYGNRKVVYKGEKFDSEKEARRWAELKLLERAGEIIDLERQKKFVLIPAQRDEHNRVVERECAYYADFAYVTAKDKQTVVEDVKGMRTDVYKIKKKLMLYVYGVRIRET